MPGGFLFYTPPLKKYACLQYLPDFCRIRNVISCALYVIHNFTKTLLMEEKHRAFLVVLSSFGGHVGNACKAYGISRRAFYYWVEQNEHFKAEIEELKEAELDDAEQMHEYLRKGIPNIVTTIDENGNTVEKMIGWHKEPDRNALEFYLERKGKSRGWGRDQAAVPERAGEVTIVRIPSNGRDDGGMGTEKPTFTDAEIVDGNFLQQGATTGTKK